MPDEAVALLQAAARPLPAVDPAAAAAAAAAAEAEAAAAQIEEPKMTGHVEGLLLPPTSSTPAMEQQIADPKGDRSLGELRKSQSARFLKNDPLSPAGAGPGAGGEAAGLAESTVMADGRGLFYDPPVRSKIERPGANRGVPPKEGEPTSQEEASAMASLPQLRVDDGTPVDPDAVHMDAHARQAMAAKFGFGQATVPKPGMQPPRRPGGTSVPEAAAPRGKGRGGGGGGGGGYGYGGGIDGQPSFDISPHGRNAAGGGRGPAGGAADDTPLGREAQRALGAAGVHPARGGLLVPPSGPPPTGPAADAGEAAGRKAASRFSAAAPERRRAAAGSLTWESLEEMSFEDLLSLEAGAAFNQLPPLPTIGGGAPAKRAVPTAPAVAAKPSKADPPPPKPKGSPRQVEQTPAKPAARAAPAAPAALALASALGKGGAAKGARAGNKPSARGAAPARPPPVQVGRLG